MASLSKLTLTKFERSQNHQEPVLERHAKALKVLAQQRNILNAALKGPEHTVKSANIYLSITNIFSIVLNGWHILQAWSKALEGNDHSTALDEGENDVAVHTGETLEECKTGDV